MDDDWDLHAVVRGRPATASTSISAGQPNFSSISFRPRFEQATVDQGLHEIYKPFIFQSPESPQISISPQKFPILNNSSPLSVLPDPTSDHQIIQRLPFTFSNGSRNAVSHTPRPKKRKNDKKRVCHVAAENLSSDVWSWRKYGQKPIKGSPYPRGYYKCSTSKGCPARKQVERNRSDQGMFIVTYTAEHNHPAPTHRNSLAGSTRQKQANSEESAKPHRLPASSPPASLSVVPEKTESSREEEADDGFSESKMCLDLEDDFFAGLEDLVSSHSAGNVGFPWLSEMGAAVDFRC